MVCDTLPARQAGSTLPSCNLPIVLPLQRWGNQQAGLCSIRALEGGGTCCRLPPPPRRAQRAGGAHPTAWMRGTDHSAVTHPHCPAGQRCGHGASGS